MASVPSWDVAQYLRFADERGRPFADLLARVRAADPALVVDLGCGPGTLTARLCDRWPRARIVAVDSSPAMVEAAREQLGQRAEVLLADVSSWQPDGAPDVIVTNAVLQWVPGHRDLLRWWASLLAPDGWLAVQVPGNQAAPHHALLRELAARDAYAGFLGEVHLAGDADVGNAQEYASILAGSGLEVDAWETTYLHLLDRDGTHGSGGSAVLQWVRGTALRPVLDVLPEGQAESFVAEYTAALDEAYPRYAYGTPLPFRRVFAVGHRPA